MVIFGYDKVINGRPITNGFQFKNGISPINLGYAGYELHLDCKDNEIELTNRKPLHKTHIDWIHPFFDFEVKQIDKISSRYYYIIDVFTYNFWEAEKSKCPKLSNRVVSDIKSGKAKILVLFINEPLLNSQSKEIILILNTWANKYGLPHKSIVLSSGNFVFGNQLKQEKYIVYIPYSIWEHVFSYHYNFEIKKRLTDVIVNRTSKEKLFLNYNRRARYCRCKLVHSLIESGIFSHGFVSLGSDLGEERGTIPSNFFNRLPITFDDTDLEINHATEFIEKDFINSYISIVSETRQDPGNIFPSEKIFKSIIGMHPFIMLASPGFLEIMRTFGYKTYSNWFDESYDLEFDLDIRISMIVKIVQRLVLKSHDNIKNMIIEMLPTIEHNLNTFLKRTRAKTFQTQLETELWK